METPSDIKKIYKEVKETEACNETVFQREIDADVLMMEEEDRAAFFRKSNENFGKVLYTNPFFRALPPDKLSSFHFVFYFCDLLAIEISCSMRVVINKMRQDANIYLDAVVFFLSEPAATLLKEITCRAYQVNILPDPANGGCTVEVNFKFSPKQRKKP